MMFSSGERMGFGLLVKSLRLFLVRRYTEQSVSVTQGRGIGLYR